MLPLELKAFSELQFSTLPSSYIRPESERPKLSEVTECDNVPIIDLSCEDTGLLTKQIGDACREYGFFQVINHGVSKEIVTKTLGVSHEFFNSPLKEKMKYLCSDDDPRKTMRLLMSFNVKTGTVNEHFITSIEENKNLSSEDPLETILEKKEIVHNWGETEGPSNLGYFKDPFSSYCTEVQQLGFRLLEAISECLGLDKDILKNALGELGQNIAVNRYPASPEPEMTYGLQAHTDPNALTILLQDFQVSGLQVLKDGKWLAIKPQPDAFVIFIGDQLQALSNERYKSVWHRAVVNADKVRLSVASFLCPCDGSNISAPKELTSGGDKPVYRDFTYAEYYQKFRARKLGQDRCLELFKN